LADRMADTLPLGKSALFSGPPSSSSGNQRTCMPWVLNSATATTAGGCPAQGHQLTKVHGQEGRWCGPPGSWWPPTGWLRALPLGSVPAARRVSRRGGIEEVWRGVPGQRRV
jgi:hypothetical protein